MCVCLCVLSASDGSFLYKLVLTGRDRGCVECDEGARELSQIGEGQNYQGFHHHSLTSTALTRRSLCSSSQYCHVTYTGRHNGLCFLSFKMFYWFLQYRQMCRLSSKQNNMTKKHKRTSIGLYLCLCMLPRKTFLLTPASSDSQWLKGFNFEAAAVSRQHTSVWVWAVDWNANLLHLIWICTFFMIFVSKGQCKTLHKKTSLQF